MRSEIDFMKEKAKLKLLLRYQRQDLKNLLLRLPGELIATGIEDSFPTAQKHKIFRRAMKGVRILFGGGLGKLLTPNDRPHLYKNSFIKKLAFMSSIGKVYRKLKQLKTINKIR